MPGQLTVGGGSQPSPTRDWIASRAGPGGPTERTLRYDQIDRAKTVFEWGPAPKPGSTPSTKRKTAAGVRTATGGDDASDLPSDPTGDGARGRSPSDTKEHSS